MICTAFGEWDGSVNETPLGLVCAGCFLIIKDQWKADEEAEAIRETQLRRE